ncbi:MAG: hypothetical protein LBQ84_05630 [Flavobacteriaceae bacterium]|jgi:hypothetical protein|nr:hypothetical protein [Flavobacteriaceae bacterium]
MKKLFTVLLITSLSVRSFAYTILQAAPPPPDDGDGSVSPHGGFPGIPATPIDSIVPLLFVSMVLLTFYIIKKKKIKTE